MSNDVDATPSPFAEAIQKLSAEKASFVDQHRERFAEAFVAETGLQPSQAVMVQRDTVGPEGTIKTEVWFRPMGPTEATPPPEPTDRRSPSGAPVWRKTCETCGRAYLRCGWAKAVMRSTRCRSCGAARQSRKDGRFS